MKQITGFLLISMALCFTAEPSLALTELLKDTEPNNQISEANKLASPGAKDRVKIIGELEPGDQDAYYWVIDEEDAGVRWNIRLQGHPDVLTRLDVMDVTEFVAGAAQTNLIGMKLEKKPPILATLATRDGVRPAIFEAVLLKPGNYVLGVSHSGGTGSYTVEISQAGAEPVRMLDDRNSAEKPYALRLQSATTLMAQADAHFSFSLSEKDAESPMGISVQTPLGVPTDATVTDGTGAEVITIRGDGGQTLRRDGLQLAAGAYQITTRSKEPSVQRLLVNMGAVAHEGTEVEPNDREEQATVVVLGETIEGHVGRPDYMDWMRFSVDDENAASMWNIIATPADPAVNLSLCLLRKELAINQCRTKDKAAVVGLYRLNLPPGDYLLGLDPRGGASDWTITWENLGPAKSGVEVEPNDSYQFAATFPDKPVVLGHFDGQDTDFWRFSVSGESQLWRAQLQGDDIFELYVHNNDGQVIQKVRAGKDDKRLRLDNLFLVPGEYFLSVSGKDADYRLVLRALGPPGPNAELEPNDEIQNALPLSFGQERNGFMPDKADVDRYQFSLAGPDHVRITAKSPADGAIRGDLLVGDDNQNVSSVYPQPEPGVQLVWDAWLPAGDYSIRLEPGILSDAEYYLKLERLPWFDGAVDREPNNDPDHASRIRADGLVVGEVGITRAAVDWYRLPAIETATAIAIPYMDPVRFSLYAGRDFKQDLLARDNSNKQHTAMLQPDTDYFLKVTGKGRYSLGLFSPSPAAETEVGSSLVQQASPVTVSLQFDDAPRAQSFSSWEQLIKGRLLLNNAGDKAQSIDLQTVLSDDRWHLAADLNGLTVAAGASLERPFTLVIPPDALPDRNVRVNVRLTDDTGRESYFMSEVVTDPDVLPANPRYAWYLPPQLRGGINAAAAAHGGKLVKSPGTDAKQLANLDALIDGLTEYGRWTEASMSVANREVSEYPMPTIELAGSQPVPVAGFLINPTSTLAPGSFLSEFEVALSMDGVAFKTVTAGKLKPTPMEQAFVLDTPVEARFARLIPLSGTFGDAYRVGAIKLGEFKVIATPGFVPDTLRRTDLASFENGGHLVWSQPWIRGSGFDTDLLAKDDKAPIIKMERGGAAEVTLGFHHSRAARVESVGLVKKSAVRLEENISRVEIAVSTTTPLGPFELLGEWPLDQAENEITLGKVTWARYLRFRFYGADDPRSLVLADKISVWEAATDDSYRSVLAEWGHYASSGPLEAAHEPRYLGPSERGTNDSRAKARLLANGEAVSGVALLDDYDAWYRLEVPAGLNTISLIMRGEPTLMAQAELLDAAGQSVPLYQQDSKANEVAWQAFVQPGQSYWLRAYEPPRALIFSWDTSASVGWYMPSMRNALYRYAEHIKPERDVVNLLPFGHSAPLLRNWQGEPYAMKLMLNSYSQETGSSEAERALAAASRALEGRPGKKGVVLLTDAATTTFADLWPALRAARPMVFALSVSSEGAFGPNPTVEQDLMQEWSRVNGGVYQYITSLGALQQGYGRAISRMRQPVTFELQAAMSFTENPGPGSLRVIAGDALADPGARGAVELILDASGSMLKRMGDKRRIQIAKDAVANVVKNVLPDGMPLALRVYGHKEAGSCRTDLEQPLAPLDKAALLTRLAQINAVNLAKTPIADSLAQVGKDLATAKGRRWVILLTDGEETCNGDPVAVLEKLAADGVDVRLNIIGFAIDNDALKAEFNEWARLGGGSYFDAGEAQALNRALTDSLQIPFRVIGRNGEQVAEGLLDGAAVELPAGSYTVELDTDPARIFRNVQLAPGKSLELSADDGGR